ncbi:hypothetical protein [Flavobacterium cellulosilyticum]|uniref:Uncharacterized protein n=1 Tax=Flavobacterium cellulosilyticum TaxID=2541731 RepID=A0A4R5CJH0_9FLAO|nr:hypothetical protein [Flavobacterium cellulosilyticum]TDD97524.1 hypothetical protein E0F76_09515 [Flavobacterium cellulosilyticum]
MKITQKSTLLFAIVVLLVSCQTKTDVNKILSNQNTKIAIMDTIANNSNLSIEMMGIMMNNGNDKMIKMMGHENRNTMMMQNQEIMIKMMENNPAMMQSLMSRMLEKFKGDTLMISAMSSIIIKNQQMMDMILKDRNLEDINKMKISNIN